MIDSGSIYINQSYNQFLDIDIDIYLTNSISAQEILLVVVDFRCRLIVPANCLSNYCDTQPILLLVAAPISWSVTWSPPSSGQKNLRIFLVWGSVCSVDFVCVTGHGSCTALGIALVLAKWTRRCKQICLVCSVYTKLDGAEISR